MKNVVIVGAGKEGKGTFGDIFYENKWNITFIDKDENVINSLNEKNSYIVEALYENYNEKHIIDHYHAYLIDDYTNSYESILNADVIVLALYPEDIKEALSKLKFSLQKRIKSNYEQKLTILCGTNKNHMMSKLENFLLDDLKIEKEWYCSNVALRDMIIRRSSNSDAKDAVQLTTKIVQTLLIQSPVYFDVSKFKWFELNNNLEMMKDIKLFTYNSPHAACAYVGYKHGYQTIEEASKNKDIKTIMEVCVLEAKKGILSSFEITAEELDDFVDAPKPNGEEREYITRVALDPIRKLSRNDRLTGIAMICMENNIECPNLIKAIAYGMSYDYKEDISAKKIQNLILEKGIKKAISDVIGVDEMHPIIKKIQNEYLKIR